ncbi:MAG: NAD(P)H-dependent glycerol-3-phosphate dehydrogenase [Pseudomonadota bacterium]
MSKGSRDDHIGILGGGAWGTALGALIGRQPLAVTLWSRNKEVCTSIRQYRENKVYLPDIPLPQTLSVTTALADLVSCTHLISVLPAQHSRGWFAQLSAVLLGPRPVAIASKGIERTTLMLMHEVLNDVWPNAIPALISGPSFAHDVARGLPTAVTVAAAEEGVARTWQSITGARHFRPYMSTDLTGVALGGSVKNVLAIAAGIVDGLGLGKSAHAALIARGYAEFQRLGLAMGAHAATMSGLSGLGDLILTAGSDRSRNMSLGIRLGRGDRLATILGARNSVSEGVASADAVCQLAARHGVEMPVCAGVADIVTGQQSVADAIDNLMSRPFKPE